MNINTVITKELKLVDNLIKKDFIKEETISGLYRYIFKSGGKKIRARLNLVSSSANKHKDRYKLASIIELLHTATLIHDDVVDNSPIRRGIKSVNNLWTNSHGVLIGDYIYSKAFILMVEIGDMNILKELAAATNDISQGELIQLDAIENLNISLNKLKKISYFKTGRLFEAAARTGALLNKSNKSNKSYLKNISESAKNLGILFQIRDDLLDYSIDLKTGKPSYQDLREGKITYPFFFAYKNANKKEQKQLRDLLGNKKLNQTAANKLIIKLDGINKTNKLAKKYFDETIEYASKIKKLSIKQEMIELANIAINRDK
jgi:octaprenyl-diphosphate synthase